MSLDPFFRWVFTFIFLATFFISAFYRRRARQLGGTVARAEEGTWSMLGRLFFALPLFGGFLAYMLNPASMAWASLPVPGWLRWLAAGVALANVFLVRWVFTSIGSNISETFLIKDQHALVTEGPYRWIRHPLYTFATLGFLALGIVAANWFIIIMPAIAFIAIAWLVVPKEEAFLIEEFGDAYRDYARSTGRFLPAIRRRG